MLLDCPDQIIPQPIIANARQHRLFIITLILQYNLRRCIGDRSPIHVYRQVKVRGAAHYLARMRKQKSHK